MKTSTNYEAVFFIILGIGCLIKKKPFKRFNKIQYLVDKMKAGGLHTFFNACDKTLPRFAHFLHYIDL